MIRIRYLGEDDRVKVPLAADNIIICYPSKGVVVILNAFSAKLSVNLHYHLHLSLRLQAWSSKTCVYFRLNIWGISIALAKMSRHGKLSFAQLFVF
jgi:hypothetical protein